MIINKFITHIFKFQEKLLNKLINKIANLFLNFQNFFKLFIINT